LTRALVNPSQMPLGKNQGRGPAMAGECGRPSRAALPERIDPLPDNAGRKRWLISDAGFSRQSIFRHPERSEQQIPKRKSPGEIGVAALFSRGMMPAVEDRRGNHIPERAEVPVEIGVDEDRMEDIERAQ